MMGKTFDTIAKTALAAFLTLSLTTPAFALDTAADPAVTPPSDADLAGITCSISEEKYLPGDYYYCLAEQSYGYKRYEKAQRYFRIAASWASKPAQYILGVMALNGDQQPQNGPLALAWFTLAAERHREDFETTYRQVSAAATPEERKAADALLKTMRPVYADEIAAVRAERRYHDGMLKLTRDSAFGVHCLSGIQSGGATASDGSNASIACGPVAALAHAIDTVAVRVFDGWDAHVTVGALEPIAPTSK